MPLLNGMRPEHAVGTRYMDSPSPRSPTTITADCNKPKTAQSPFAQPLFIASAEDPESGAYCGHPGFGLFQVGKSTAFAPLLAPVESSGAQPNPGCFLRVFATLA